MAARPFAAHLRRRLLDRTGALMLSLMSLAGCMSTREAGGEAPAASATEVKANVYLLPEFMPHVTTLKDFSSRWLFTMTSPLIGIVVAYAEGGAVVQESIGTFLAGHANGGDWVLVSYTGGYSMPTGSAGGSDKYKWVGTSMVNKGGEVGVVIEPPVNQKPNP